MTKLIINYMVGLIFRPVFRSYNPAHEDLQVAAIPKAAPIDIESQVADSLEHSNVTKLVEDVVSIIYLYCMTFCTKGFKIT